MAGPGESDLLQVDELGLNVPRPNLLRNGGFRDARYGTTFAAPANTTETLSDWYVLTAGAGAVDVAQESAVVPSGTYAACRLTVTATNNLKFGLVGFLYAEEAAVLIGRTASLSVALRMSAGSTLSFMRAAVLSWTGAVDTEPTDVVAAWNAAGVLPTWAANYTLENTAQNMPLTTSYHTFRFPAIKIDTPGTKNVAVLIWSDDTTTTAGDFVSIADVSLVAGSQPADIERTRRVSTADLINSSVSSAKILNGTIATADLADGAVTFAKLANLAVGTSALIDGAVTSAKIADGTILAGDLADGSVTTAKILDATILAGDLADGAVTSAKILDATIATGDLAASAISQVVLSNTATGQTTTSTTLVEIDATNCSVTLTPVTGTVLLVQLEGSISNNTANAFTAFAMYQDGVSQGEYSVATSATANAYCSIGGSQLLTGTAGVSTTIRLRWRVSSGTASVNQIKFCVVELKR